MHKWFPIVSHISGFKLLSFCSSHMLCTLGNTVRTIYHGKSSSKTNRVGIKKHQLWNNRIGGTSLPHCCNSSCYSLVFELLTNSICCDTDSLTSYLFIYLFTWWCELVQIETPWLDLHVHSLVKNMHLQNVNFSGMKQHKLAYDMSTAYSLFQLNLKRCFLSLNGG